MATNNERLQEAYRLIREGRNTAAQELLLPLVREQTWNADAWWLLANALGDSPGAVYALQQVLSLRPDDERARRLLERLQTKGLKAETPFASPFASIPAVQPMPAADDFSDFSPSNASSTDPFGSSVSTASSGGASPDPFAGVPKSGEKRKNDFSYPSSSPGYPPPRARAGTHPCVVVLAFIGALTLVACSLCGLIFISGAGSFGQAMTEAFGTLENDPEFAQAMEVFATQGFNFNFDSSGGFSSFSGTLASPSVLPARLPGDAAAQGETEYGASERATLADDTLHTYTFTGTAGDTVIITFDSIESLSAFDPVVGLYDPADNQAAFDDDGGEDRNARLTYTLTETGKYTIVVGSWNNLGGQYVLALARER
ncbi:MAG: pre-peptidase C-terminal domain-containing protein [bacterium]|nr:pre-peptidase C-terminal domain-containing protein [bacterium]